MAKRLLLAEQDRSRWDRTAVVAGVELVGRALRHAPDHPDRYVVQAAIAACHALAPAYDRALTLELSGPQAAHLRSRAGLPA
ncbi:hypothetical protein ACIBTW_29930 [Micromonospora parva]|uniref:hypothetical protein n=1 Tax=Micromonospora parva TaxID=1464048 RepID=UPI00378C234B